VQYVVKAGTWFGSFPNEGTPYSLVGCTVAPGFAFEVRFYFILLKAYLEGFHHVCAEHTIDTRCFSFHVFILLSGPVLFSFICIIKTVSSTLCALGF